MITETELRRKIDHQQQTILALSIFLTAFVTLTLCLLALSIK